MISRSRQSALLTCLLVVSIATLVRAQAPRGAARAAAPPSNTVVQRRAAMGAAGPASAGRQPVGPPPGFELTPAEEQQVNQLLRLWENRTSGIKTFQTDYSRFEYDPIFGPKNEYKTKSAGEIRYAAPDRGMIKEKDVFHYDAEKAKRGAKPPFSRKEGYVGEHWVCDGKSVFEFDHSQRQLVETKLPPEMQGNAIADGPLPFMFGAKADSIRRRYWVRQLPRQSKEQPFQLDFVPKQRGESFDRAKVYLSSKEFLPERMDVADLNGKGKVVYLFKNPQVNSVKHNLQNFWNVFVSPKLPRGWRKTVRNVGQPAGAQQAPGPQQARGPAAPRR